MRKALFFPAQQGQTHDNHARHHRALEGIASPHNNVLLSLDELREVGGTAIFGALSSRAPVPDVVSPHKAFLPGAVTVRHVSGKHGADIPCPATLPDPRSGGNVLLSGSFNSL